MSRKKVQPINPNADCFVSAFDEDTSKSVSYKEIIGYGDAILFGYGGSNPTPFDTPGEIDDLKIPAIWVVV